MPDSLVRSCEVPFDTRSVPVSPRPGVSCAVSANASLLYLCLKVSSCAAWHHTRRVFDCELRALPAPS